MPNLRLACIAVLALSLFGGSALGGVNYLLNPNDSSSSVLLSDLIDDASDSVTVQGVAGLTFDDFFYFGYGWANGGSGSSPDADEVKVYAYQDGLDVGLIFEAVDPAAWEGAGDVGGAEAFINFAVTADGFLIDGAALWLPDGSWALDTGSGTAEEDVVFAAVSETQFTTPGGFGSEPLEELGVRVESTGSGINNVLTQDSVTFGGVDYLYVKKDIKVTSQSPDGSASLTAVGQAFSIPEPATMVLLAVGGIGFVLRRRRAALMVALMVAAFAIASPAQAAVITLNEGDTAQLNGTDTIKYGDLEFSNFALSGSAGAGSYVPDALEELRVHAIAAGGNIGLEFQGVWVASLGTSAVSTLTFDVTSTNPDLFIGLGGLGISRYSLIDQSPTPGAFAFVEINETINDGQAELLALRVHAEKPEDLQDPNDLYDEGTVADQVLVRTVSVEKVIDLQSSCSGETAMMSGFYQLYDLKVPEPATMSVLALGGLAVVIRRRK